MSEEKKKPKKPALIEWMEEIEDRVGALEKEIKKYGDEKR